MSLTIFFGILLPFIGTTLGSATVFLSRKSTNEINNTSLSGFAAGVMMAACVWSLIIPAVEMSCRFGFFAFFPMLSGLWFGVVFLMLCEKILPVLLQKHPSGGFLLILAVTLHNIPEGLAVGVAFAAAITGKSPSLLASAFMLSFGMALQNVPEGAIIAFPTKKEKNSLPIAFIIGSLSGIVEPIAAFITLAFSSFTGMILPYLLGFAAGAMIFVCVKELIPDAKGTKGCLYFMLGFSVMMVLDVALG